MLARADADALCASMEDAWNAGDGAGWAASFAEDADFVNVLGQHARGRAAIGAGHQEIFDGIYRGSRNRMAVEDLRALDDRISLMHVSATLDVPGGPMAGTHRALMSIVVDGSGSKPLIVALHNTMLRERPGV
ncbi:MULTISPECIES: SgcJ/EcaC family oxidoreductase [Sphingomonas]|uniref:SgcJ/EcaC family oxidoreductase n=1 Tax=Sphingomonas TaxID=13687 RepID=UPI000DEFE665|nr:MULTISPECIES: SgcJ/EcaC family oxidoreductase [Sphingomonas]